MASQHEAPEGRQRVAHSGHCGAGKCAMIDPATGILTINPNLILDPTGATGMLHEEVPLPEPEEWRTLERQPIRDAAGRKMALRVHLHRDRLEQAALFYYLPDEPDFGTWDDWSYENEMRRKDLH